MNKIYEQRFIYLFMRSGMRAGLSNIGHMAQLSSITEVHVVKSNKHIIEQKYH